MSLELLNSASNEGRELGYLCLRLATLNAEKSAHPAALRRSLERRIDAITKRATRQEQPTAAEESQPMSAERAAAKTELLKRSV